MELSVTSQQNIKQTNLNQKSLRQQICEELQEPFSKQTTIHLSDQEICFDRKIQYSERQKQIIRMLHQEKIEKGMLFKVLSMMTFPNLQNLTIIQHTSFTNLQILGFLDCPQLYKLSLLDQNMIFNLHSLKKLHTKQLTIINFKSNFIMGFQQLQRIKLSSNICSIQTLWLSHSKEIIERNINTMVQSLPLLAKIQFQGNKSIFIKLSRILRYVEDSYNLLDQFYHEFHYDSDYESMKEKRRNSLEHLKVRKFFKLCKKWQQHRNLNGNSI